jgi:GNAT superfamily N-acetyltransferase
VTIRPARAEEAAALTALALRSKAHWGYDDAFMERAATELQVTDVAGVFVVERDGALAGFHRVDGDELSMLFVEPGAMGAGVGTALLDHARAHAHASGIEELTIESDPNAAPFYARHGAQHVGERRSPSTGRALPLLRLATSRDRQTG